MRPSRYVSSYHQIFFFFTLLVFVYAVLSFVIAVTMLSSAVVDESASSIGAFTTSVFTISRNRKPVFNHEAHRRMSMSMSTSPASASLPSAKSGSESYSHLASKRHQYINFSSSNPTHPLYSPSPIPSSPPLPPPCLPATILPYPPSFSFSSSSPSSSSSSSSSSSPPSAFSYHYYPSLVSADLLSQCSFVERADKRRMQSMQASRNNNNNNNNNNLDFSTVSAAESIELAGILARESARVLVNQRIDAGALVASPALTQSLYHERRGVMPTQEAEKAIKRGKEKEERKRKRREEEEKKKRGKKEGEWKPIHHCPLNKGQSNEMPDLDRVDVVYTYVNGSDPYFLSSISSFSSSPVHANKYRDWDELRYSLRSLHEYAHYITRCIFIVVAAESQIPHWLIHDNEHTPIKIVYHKTLVEAFIQQHSSPPSPFPSSPLPLPLTSLTVDSVLPTFNSLTIESFLHYIDGLTEHFIYINNDLYIGRRLYMHDFMHIKNSYDSVNDTDVDDIDSYYNRYTDYEVTFGNECHAYLQNADYFINDAYLSRTNITVSAMQYTHKIGFTASTFLLTTEGAKRCLSDPMFVNGLITTHYFNHLNTHWYTHTPHMWSKSVLTVMEMRLWPLLERSRRNRFRCAYTDVMIHVQYEAARVYLYKTNADIDVDVNAIDSKRRQHISDDEIKLRQSFRKRESEQSPATATATASTSMCTTCAVVEVGINTMSRLNHDSLYIYALMYDRDVSLQSYVALTHKYNSMRPLFFGLDDDLSAQVTPVQLEYHRIEMKKFQEKFWGQRAPWEKDGVSVELNQRQPGLVF